MNQQRLIRLSQVVAAVREMCGPANYDLNPDIYQNMQQQRQQEKNQTGQYILDQLIQNADIAREKQLPICQDTGMAVFFVAVGQDCRLVDDLGDQKTTKNDLLTGQRNRQSVADTDQTKASPAKASKKIGEEESEPSGSAGWTLSQAINEGVRQGYQAGYLRKSVVADPFLRENTGTNTPAIIHYQMVAGDRLTIDFAPKGFGSENMSRIYMLKPSDGMAGAKQKIIQTIAEAGPNPCPPMVVGVGIGGDFELAAILAKKALLRPLGENATLPHIKQMEQELVSMANQLNIGPQGFGGDTTVLGIHILTYPTHIAGLPVAINISCHATRHRQVVL